MLLGNLLGQGIKLSNLLFVLANQGSGGHRLGRIISCLDNVYWYSHKKNGIRPWDTEYNDTSLPEHEQVAGKTISKYHYDRLIGDTSVPLVGQRIEKWWNKLDVDKFYSNVWFPKFNIPQIQSIADTQYIHWVLHDTPDELLERFPSAKIISLIDEDIDKITERHLITTSYFPSYYRLTGLKPSYVNDHAKAVYDLRSINPNATERDLWFYKTKGTVDKYVESIKTSLHRDNVKRENCNDIRHLKVKWSTFNIDHLTSFLLSESVNEEYTTLLI